MHLAYGELISVHTAAEEGNKALRLRLCCMRRESTSVERDQGYSLVVLEHAQDALSDLFNSHLIVELYECSTSNAFNQGADAASLMKNA